MIRRQFLPPEPANHLHSLICEPVSEQANAKCCLSHPHHAVGDNKTVRHQRRCVVARLDAGHSFAIHHSARHHDTKTLEPFAFSFYVLQVSVCLNGGSVVRWFGESAMNPFRYSLIRMRFT